MNDIQIGVACTHCGWPHYYPPDQIRVDNGRIRYTCKTSGLVGWEPNDPPVLEWLQANGVSSVPEFAVPPSAEVPDRRPEPVHRVRGISLTWLPPAIAAFYVILVATGIVPRTLVMLLGVPVAVWVAWAVTRRWTT